MSAENGRPRSVELHHELLASRADLFHCLVMRSDEKRDECSAYSMINSPSSPEALDTWLPRGHRVRHADISGVPSMMSATNFTRQFGSVGRMSLEHRPSEFAMS